MQKIFTKGFLGIWDLLFRIKLRKANYLIIDTLDSITRASSLVVVPVVPWNHSTFQRVQRNHSIFMQLLNNHQFFYETLGMLTYGNNWIQILNKVTETAVQKIMDRFHSLKVSQMYYRPVWIYQSFDRKKAESLMFPECHFRKSKKSWPANRGGRPPIFDSRSNALLI